MGTIPARPETVAFDVHLRQKGNTMDKPKIIDRVAGCLFGTAIGDALGYPVEFSKQWPHKPQVTLENYNIDRYSDDTQMTRAVMEALIRARTHNDLNAAAEEIAEEFVSWMKAPHEGSHRAPGGACMHGCRNLDAGKPWRDAGQPFQNGSGGGGCGAAMRSAPYGLWFPDAPLTAAMWAGEHCLMTHGAPMGQASAAAVAAGVAACFSATHPIDVAHAMIDAAYDYDATTALMLAQATTFVFPAKNSPLQAICEVVENFDTRVVSAWLGWAGHDAVAASLYCFLRYSTQPVTGLLTAVNSPGDSDSLGAITGALLGAYGGLESFPEQWIEKKVERADELHNLAARFLEARKDTKTVRHESKKVAL